MPRPWKSVIYPTLLNTLGSIMNPLALSHSKAKGTDAIVILHRCFLLPPGRRQITSNNGTAYKRMEEIMRTLEHSLRSALPFPVPATVQEQSLPEVYSGAPPFVQGGQRTKSETRLQSRRYYKKVGEVIVLFIHLCYYNSRLDKEKQT